MWLETRIHGNERRIRRLTRRRIRLEDRAVALSRLAEDADANEDVD
jgi:hypothetical protein